MKTVGERIKDRRKELGYTQDELADIMGYSSKTSVSRAENYGNELTTTKLRKFAKALRCSESFLMGWDDVEDDNVPGYSSDTAEVLLLYSKLNDEQKKSVLTLLRSFSTQ